MRQIPGLNDLRVFECAARLQNFRQAAEELHLTHGAVSHRIRALEDQLSIALFERQNGVTLTEAGRELYGAVKQSLELISNAIDTITAQQTEHYPRLRLAVLPTFAARWLLPRLTDFYSAHPHIALQIEASYELVDIGVQGVDAAIRLGTGQWKGLQSDLLLRDYYYPVASPSFVQQHHLNTPADLCDVPLLAHAFRSGTGCSWEDYFSHLSIRSKKPLNMTTFDDGNLVIQAAEQGMGVALVRHSLACFSVQQNKLTPLFDYAMHSPYHYYFVQPLVHNKTVLTQTLFQWLKAQVDIFESNKLSKVKQWKWLTQE